MAAECKTCTKERSRTWYKANKDKARKSAREAQRRRRLREPELTELQWRAAAYKKFGITVEDYEQMHDSQDGVCKICKLPQSGRFKNLAVDHDHETGEVRGLLCMTCNRNLGYFEKYKDAVGDYLST